MYARAIIFRNLLNNLRTGVKFQVIFNLFKLLHYQLRQDSSALFFEKVKGTSRNDTYELLKISRSGYILIFKKL